jgi:hypothetical protein
MIRLQRLHCYAGQAPTFSGFPIVYSILPLWMLKFFMPDFNIRRRNVQYFCCNDLQIGR